MHVRSLVVTRYGPMTPFQDDRLAPFTVLHGPNEQGKTLLIDALVRMLFKKKLKRSALKLFGNLGRVNETPEGYVVLATHAEEIKLGDNDTIDEVAPFAMTPEDFRNIFLIRDSDLSVRDERDFYEGITEKLTGIRSSEIDRLLKIIQRLGRLRSITPESALGNSAENDKIADRIRAALALVKDIGTLREELAQNDFDGLVQELVAVRDGRLQREKERERHRAAERRARLERAQGVVVEVRKLQEHLEQTRQFDTATLKGWRALSVERATLQRDVNRDERTADTMDREIKKGAAEEAARERRAVAAADRLRAIENALQNGIDAYQHDRAEFRRDDSQAGATRIGFFASVGVTVAALVLAVVTPSVLTVAVAVVTAAIAAALGWSVRRTARTRAGLLARAEALCSDAARHGITVETVNELASAIADVERAVSDRRAEAAEKGGEVSAMRKDRERLAESLSTRRGRVGEIDAEIAGLCARTGMSTVEELEVAVDERSRVSATLQARLELLHSLTSLSPLREASLAEQVDRVADEIERQLGGPPGEKVGSDDPEAGPRLDRQIRELAARERELSAQIADGNRRLHAIEVKAASLRILDEAPRCRTVAELEHVRDDITAFCDRIAREQALAQEAIRIFQSIDQEERQRVGDLFGNDSSVSRLFREFTDGRYRVVTYEPEQNQVFVERMDGLRMRATALSGGAFDQLYLAIRISIAERLLPESAGFFIMDDPFIKADGQRLGRLLRTLERLVERGWQVLYFTAKDEVVNALREGIEAGRVKRIDLGTSLFTPAPREAPTLWGAQMD